MIGYPALYTVIDPVIDREFAGLSDIDIPTLVKGLENKKYINQPCKGRFMVIALVMNDVDTNQPMLYGPRLVVLMYVLFRPHARINERPNIEEEMPFSQTHICVDVSDTHQIIRLCNRYNLAIPDFIEVDPLHNPFLPRY
ncbi:MAG: hypothetical protein ACOCXQ_03195 [Patescibacteria group bacterium]